jgi:hypothetical protein
LATASIIDENSDTKFDGYEVGTQFRKPDRTVDVLGRHRAHAVGPGAQRLAAQHRRHCALEHVATRIRRSTVQLQAAFNLKVAEMAMIQNWVQMFSHNVTPPLVTNTLMGLPGPRAKAVGFENKRYLLAWKQLGEGTISAQRGNRTDGLPKTIHDVNPRVPFEFEISHWARTHRRAAAAHHPVAPRVHLQRLDARGAVRRQACAAAPLMTPEGVTQAARRAQAMLANPSTSRRRRRRRASDTWLDQRHAVPAPRRPTSSGSSSASSSRPARWCRRPRSDILLDRADPLLTILQDGRSRRQRPLRRAVRSERLSPRAIVAAAQPFELYERVWDGSGEGGLGRAPTSVPDGLPEVRLSAASGPPRPTTSRAYYVHGELKDVWADRTCRLRAATACASSLACRRTTCSTSGTTSWRARSRGRTTPTAKLEEHRPVDLHAGPARVWRPTPLYYQSHKGLFNISKLSPADVFVSLPRFAGVDPAQINVDIRPPASELKCCTDWRLFVEPTSGVTMGKDVVTQINFKSAGYGAFTNFALPAGYHAARVDRGSAHDPAVADAEKFRDGLATASMARILFFVLGPLDLCALLPVHGLSPLCDRVARAEQWRTWIVDTRCIDPTKVQCGGFIELSAIRRSNFF